MNRIQKLLKQRLTIVLLQFNSFDSLPTLYYCYHHSGTFFLLLFHTHQHTYIHTTQTGGTNNNTGNKRYRRMVEDRQLYYFHCENVDKPLVALAIVREWRSQDPPGRFLKEDDAKTGLWIDVGDRKAREKTSQALREKAPTIRKQEKERMVGGVGVGVGFGFGFGFGFGSHGSAGMGRGHEHERVAGFSHKRILGSISGPPLIHHFQHHQQPSQQQSPYQPLHGYPPGRAGNSHGIALPPPGHQVHYPYSSHGSVARLAGPPPPLPPQPLPLGRSLLISHLEELKRQRDLLALHSLFKDLT
jgi:hypothetical protein